ncbi:hypothetical protein [Paenibacillus arenilitoris]|uniref:Nuclear transport factor 2 family protein n=1 Tax=Paenibacillus arenilitoris TaxID=2772299 RepID=A0A927CKL5_9BACL|nr:hypothetical protein [Paenibacillus arenilitoris]MBD2868902.1 hypothetical protein [Paenibacillus arenilitoris]
MKKSFLIMLIFTLSSMLTGCNFIEEQKAEDIIKDYYQAIRSEDYEKAFKQLQLYDYDARTGDGHYTEGTTLSNEEAKAFYLKKIYVLKEQNYKLKGFEIIEVEYEDGHSFWHHIKLEVEQNGHKFEWIEVADIYEGKLIIGEKDDPFAMYRDGKMNFEIESLKENENTGSRLSPW